MGAERVVFILGWDVHSRTDLAPGGANDGLPYELAEFLRAVLKRQRHILVEEPDRQTLRRTLVYWGVPLMSLLGLAAAWHWTPLLEWLEPEKLTAWAQGLAASPWGGGVAVMGFLLGSLIAAPVSVLIVVTALIFGPFMGFVYALVGALII